MDGSWTVSPTHQWERVSTPVLIIGAGAAGIRVAIELAEQGRESLLLWEPHGANHLVRTPWRKRWSSDQVAAPVSNEVLHRMAGTWKNNSDAGRKNRHHSVRLSEAESIPAPQTVDAALVE